MPDHDAELRDASLRPADNGEKALTGRIFKDKKGGTPDGTQIVTGAIKQAPPNGGHGVYRTEHAAFLVTFKHGPRAMAAAPPPSPVEPAEAVH